MYRLVVPKKNAGDAAVTGFYMNIVLEGCKKAGKNCEVHGTDFQGDKKNDVILVDEALKLFKLWRKGYKNFILWSQGVVPEESFMRNHSKLRFLILSLVERFALNRSSLVLLCSPAMLAHYEKKYHISLRDKSVIMPCFNESDVNHAAFNVPNKYTTNRFLYVGSIKAWQCFEQTVSIYKAIEEKSEVPTELHVFTGQQAEALEILNRHGVKNYTVGYANADELREHIKSMKYGFVIREDTTVNNVATPTKFSNYISNGIIPIYSSCVKGFAEEDLKNNMGIICNLDKTEQGISNVIEHMRRTISTAEMEKQCVHWFETYYCRENYVRQIAEKIQLLGK